VARKALATEGDKIIDRVLNLSRKAREEINKIDGLYAFGKELIGNPGVYDFDETKLSVCVKGLGLTGFKVYDILRDEYNIQLELGDVCNILAIISVGDTEESIIELIKALEDIAIKYKTKPIEFENIALENPEIVVSPRDAFYTRKKVIKLDDAEGQISGESIMAYPPGIPIVTPGERINKEIINYIKFLKTQHSMLSDTEDPDVETIKVLGM
jgi:arginine/lysine/ornithine decarboxylase